MHPLYPYRASICEKRRLLQWHDLVWRSRTCGWFNRVMASVRVFVYDPSSEFWETPGCEPLA